MGGRRQRFRPLKAGLHIVGEGLTEYYYFKHLKGLFNYVCTIKPRFCKNTCIKEMDATISQLLEADATVICVFDADNSLRNKSESDQLQALKKKYKSSKNVIFCDSMPSIEYWFLIHYSETRSGFASSKEVTTALKKHIRNFKKTKKFLEKHQWVKKMSVTDGNLNKAIQWASSAPDNSSSYSKIYRAIHLLDKESSEQ